MNTDRKRMNNVCENNFDIETFELCLMFTILCMYARTTSNKFSLDSHF